MDARAEPAGALAAWRESSIGVEIYEHGWSVYSGLTVAPFAGGLTADGLRLRSTGGYGRYRYDGKLVRRGVEVPTTFRGVASFADILVGFQHQLERTTVKAYAGAASLSHQISPFDEANAASGGEVGFKAVLETWTELGDKAWASLDLSWSNAHETYASRLRAGWRLQPELSLGLEAGVHGNLTYDGGRGGLFARYAVDWGEISVSTGLTGDIERPDAAYAAFGWLMRY